jgi:hypothetical protein
VARQPRLVLEVVEAGEEDEPRQLKVATQVQRARPAAGVPAWGLAWAVVRERGRA